MMRLSLALAGSLAAIATCAAADRPPPTFSAFYGTWKVGKVAGAASITESQQSADAAVGSDVRISAGLIETYNKHDACKPQNPKVSEVDTEKTLEGEFGTRASDLYLPKNTLPPRAAYLDAGCAFALVINQNTLLWPMGNGYIYTAKRQPVSDAR